MAGKRDAARAQRFKDLRAAAGLTQSAVADSAGVAVRSVQQWEDGGKIGWPNAVRVAAVLKTTPLYLMNGDTTGTTPPLELADPDEERRPDERMRGTFQQVAELVSALRDEMNGAITELREALEAQSGTIAQLVAEMATLRREQAAPARSGSTAKPKRTPRQKQLPPQ